jgi:hypothetical protein
MRYDSMNTSFLQTAKEQFHCDACGICRQALKTFVWISIFGFGPVWFKPNKHVRYLVTSLGSAAKRISSTVTNVVCMLFYFNRTEGWSVLHFVSSSYIICSRLLLLYKTTKQTSVCRECYAAQLSDLF